jgi:hypothetical protein
MTLTNILYAVAVIVIVLNIYVNFRLILSSDFDRFQKIAQSIIIWVIPFFGAVIVWFIVSDSGGKGPGQRNFGGGSGSDIAGIS